MGNWRPPTKCRDDALMASFTSSLVPRETIDSDLLPDLRNDPELVLVSDYAGEHKGSGFQVLAYLIADRPGILRRWDTERRAIRQEHLKDGRRISFKGLGDRRKQNALGPFLSSADSINGLLFCVAFGPSVDPFAAHFQWLNQGQEDDATRPRWKPQVWEKLIRVALFGSVLVGGLCRPGQNLHWITDDDEIVPNEEFQTDASRVIGAILHQYCAEEMGEFALGIAGRFDDERRAEDLVSIVDLAAGAIAENLTALSEDRVPKSSNLSLPTPNRTSTKTVLIHAWLSEVRVPLKKILCLVRPAGPGKRLLSFGSPVIGVAPPGRLWLPPDKGWRTSARAW